MGGLAGPANATTGSLTLPRAVSHGDRCAPLVAACGLKRAITRGDGGFHRHLRCRPSASDHWDRSPPTALPLWRRRGRRGCRSRLQLRHHLLGVAPLRNLLVDDVSSTTVHDQNRNRPLMISLTKTVRHGSLNQTGGSRSDRGATAAQPLPPVERCPRAGDAEENVDRVVKPSHADTDGRSSTSIPGLSGCTTADRETSPATPIEMLARTTTQGG